MTRDIASLSLPEIADRIVVDPYGTKVGTVFDVYLDDTTRAPAWLAVATGLFGTKTSFVPVDGAEVDGSDRLVIPYSKEFVKSAPRADPDGDLSEDEEAELHAYYGRIFDVPGVARLRRWVDAEPVTADPPVARDVRVERVDVVRDVRSTTDRQEERR